MEALYWTLLIVGGFLLGSIMFGQLIPKLVAGKDIYKESPDHNPGTFNAFEMCGKGVGILCGALDVLKGFIPVILASLLMNTDSIWYVLTLIAPALGHAIGLFNHFHGGKCIAVIFGIFLGLIPVTWIPFVVLVIFFLPTSTFIKINPGSLRSIIVFALTALVSTVVLAVLGQYYAMIGTLLLCLLPIVRFTVWKPKSLKIEDQAPVEQK